MMMLWVATNAVGKENPHRGPGDTVPAGAVPPPF